MKKILTFILLLSGNYLFAQGDIKKTLEDLNIIKQPKEIKTDSRLYKLGTLAKQYGTTKAKEFTLTEGDSDSQSTVTIRINNEIPKEESIDNEYLRQLGLEVINTRKRQSLCKIDTDKIIDIAKKLKDGYLMITPPKVTADLLPPEGPTLTNSLTYKNGGKGGDNLTIAIIDQGFSGLQTAITGAFCKTPAYMFKNGASVSTVSSFESGSTTNHGRLVFETIYAHAPEATYELYLAPEYVYEVYDCLDRIDSRNVDIINMSLGATGYVWNLDETFENAIPNDALFIISAGNDAQGHLQIVAPNISEGDYVKFNATDTYNRIAPTTLIQPNQKVNIKLTWSPFGLPNDAYNQGYSAADLDLFLYKYNNNTGVRTQISSSTTTDFYELIEYTNTSNAPEILEYRIKVHNVFSPNFFFYIGEIEVFVGYSSNSGSGGIPTEHQNPANSLNAFSNSTNTNVQVIGAVDKGDYNSPNGTTNILTDYSTQGPNNSNVGLGVDYVAPTNTGVSTGSPATFGGTSCAAPNAAGTIAAFWSAHSYYSIQGIRGLLNEKSLIYKDWGTTGEDFIYGKGGLFLHNYIPNSKYMNRSSNNNDSGNTPYNFSPFLPYYNMLQAQYDMPNNGTVLIIGGDSFPQNSNVYGNTVNQGSGKKITYKTVGLSSAKFGF